MAHLKFRDIKAINYKGKVALSLTGGSVLISEKRKVEFNTHSTKIGRKLNNDNPLPCPNS